MRKALVLVFFIYLITACGAEKNKPITLAINPWPGYEFLFLAEQKGFFQQVGLNLKLVQLSSLSDGLRAYLRNNTDGMASTLIEAIQAQAIGNKPLKVVMVTDYSNGGDVILTHRSIKSIQDLKGKTIGCEISSLGLFLLQRALDKARLTLADINLVNIEQVDGKQALLSNRVDAFISYPPVSMNILTSPDYHSIFSSADIPQEVVDVVSFSEQALENNPDLVNKLHQAWDMALTYYQEHPEESAKLMAKREQVSVADFMSTVSNDIQLLASSEQKKILKNKGLLQDTIRKTCTTLVHSGAIDIDCNSFSSIIYSQS